MSTFVDTSALYALLDEGDRNHERAVARWRTLVADARIATHAYVIVETTALVQRRLGMAAAQQLHGRLLPPVHVEAVSTDLHRRAVARWQALGLRELSLVDVTSFTYMDDLLVTEAFAFDDDFGAQGYALTPR